MLEEAWGNISRVDRSILIDHFLADGINDPAFLFVFLPLYLSNAKNNTHVGLKCAFEVLINLLEVLRAEGLGGPEAMTTTVDLSDLAAFTKEVKSPRIFTVVAQQLKINAMETDVQLLVVTKHWQLVNLTSWDGDQVEVAQLLKTMDRKTDEIVRTLEAVKYSQEVSLQWSDEAFTDGLDLIQDSESVAEAGLRRKSKKSICKNSYYFDRQTWSGKGDNSEKKYSHGGQRSELGTPIAI